MDDASPVDARNSSHTCYRRNIRGGGHCLSTRGLNGTKIKEKTKKPGYNVFYIYHMIARMPVTKVQINPDRPWCDVECITACGIVTLASTIFPPTTMNTTLRRVQTTGTGFPVLRPPTPCPNDQMNPGRNSRRAQSEIYGIPNRRRTKKPATNEETDDKRRNQRKQNKQRAKRVQLKIGRAHV